MEDRECEEAESCRSSRGTSCDSRRPEREGGDGPDDSGFGEYRAEEEEKKQVSVKERELIDAIFAVRPCGTFE